MSLVSLLGMALSLLVNIWLTKTKIGRWDSNSTLWFVLSIGQFGSKANEIWLGKAGFREEEVSTIVQHQFLSLLGGILSFFASAALAALVVT